MEGVHIGGTHHIGIATEEGEDGGDEEADLQENDEPIDQPGQSYLYLSLF
jgi:hypothetical protein